MTALTKILALVLALAVIAGAPKIVFAGSPPGSAHSTLTTGGDGGCCGESTSMSPCDMTCAMSVAAVTQYQESGFGAPFSSVPSGGDSEVGGRTARAPDTAPPKSFPG